MNAVFSAPALAAKILRYELSDVLRGRWVVAYACFFLLLSEGLLRFGGGGGQAVLSLLNVVLILLPLVSLLFGALYLYNARDFTEMMLAQPVGRGALFAGLYGGLFVPLAAGFAVGVSLPFVWHPVEAATLATLARLVLTGVLLTASFLALAFVVATRFEDRARGLGVALLVWLGLAVAYDGLVLFVVYTFAAYPLEGPMIALALFNPISLARVLLLLTLDVAALLGYTGAAFERFFGTAWGTGLSLAALLAWWLLPLALARRLFVRKDF